MAKKNNIEARRVIVRTFSAGVHYGTLVSREGREVVLSDARRIWRWRGANTLHEMSRRGIDASHSRVSESVREITLTEAIEIIPCEAEAIAKIDSARWSPS